MSADADVEALRRFRRCGAEASPARAQLVELDFEIGVDGRVLMSALPATPLEGCLDRSLSQLAFSSESGAASRVVYPLHFVPASAGVPAPRTSGSGADEHCDCGG